MTVTRSLSELAALLNATLDGDGHLLIRGVNSLELAAEHEISYAEKASFIDKLAVSGASACVVDHDFPQVSDKNLLRVTKPKLAFIELMKLFGAQANYQPGVAASASIAPSTTLAEGVHVGACAVIKGNSSIGIGTVIDAGCVIDEEVFVGRGCRIGPNVTLMRGTRIGDRVVIQAGTVIGGDGFGYVWSGTEHVKVPQLGTVVIENDVEIGCNVCVDRATFGVTRIRRGARIDNLVQVAHNNDIGEHVILVAQVGLSGSVSIGTGAILAGQVGVTDHTEIGAGARIGGASAVTKNVPAGEIVWGYPARPMRLVLKETALGKRVPQMLARLKALELRVQELMKKLGASDSS